MAWLILFYPGGRDLAIFLVVLPIGATILPFVFRHNERSFRRACHLGGLALTVWTLCTLIGTLGWYLPSAALLLLASYPAPVVDETHGPLYRLARIAFVMGVRLVRTFAALVAVAVSAWALALAFTGELVAATILVLTVPLMVWLYGPVGDALNTPANNERGLVWDSSRPPL